MPRRILLFCLAGLAVNFGVAWSTTVVPIGFDSLVSKAELIFVGKVVDRRSVYAGGRTRLIVTDVTFDVLRVIKGAAGMQTRLTFLGGRVGAEGLVVTGMPQFEIGDRDVLFVGDRTASSPLVGFWQGRFRVRADSATGRDVVYTHNGGPIFEGFGDSPAMKARRAGGTNGVMPQSRSLSLGDFESLVRNRVGTTTARPFR
ncbi:MAG TPA: hypothetical protein VEA16_18265 [Vicinamibacterales bacterium]|nr:hypothetical protein [Vicinamibacterales bacterium]